MINMSPLYLLSEVMQWDVAMRHVVEIQNDIADKQIELAFVAGRTLRMSSVVVEDWRDR